MIRVAPATMVVATMGPSLLAPRPMVSVSLAIAFTVAHALLAPLRARIAVLRERSIGELRAVISAVFLTPLIWSTGPDFPGWTMAVPVMLALPFITPVGKEWGALGLVGLSILLGRYCAGTPIPRLIAGLIAFASVGFLSASIARMMKGLLESLESANEAKSRFLANMSHELRTPLAGMISLNELALSAEPNESTRSLISTARTSGEHLLAILNDILDLSKIEARKLELESIAFDLRTSFTQVASIAEASAQAKGLIIEPSIDVSQDWWIGDPTRIRQVLLNLTSNAVKFSTTGRIHISAREDGEMIVFSVRDQGVGMSAEHLKRIYEPFSQADVCTTRVYGGTGLGLSICWHLVKAMNGTIAAESELGKGTQIAFRIPLLRAAPLVAPAVEASRVARRLRILVAEDNPTNQLIIRKMLEGLGHEAVLVEDGEAAVLAARSDRFDVVLMDVQMPKRDGLDATRAIRAHEVPRASQVPIIGLTANAMRGDAEAGRAAGMTGYLVKPVGRRALQEALMQATQ